MDVDFHIRYTDPPITPFGNLTNVMTFYQESGLQDVISSAPLPHSGSNWGYVPIDIIEGFLISVILGVRHLAHVGLLRHNRAEIEIFGWIKSLESGSKYCRFFKKLDIDLIDEIFIELNRWKLSKLRVKYHTVDIDPTVISHYGNQDGVEVGYNPRMHSRKSHHPLIAFVAEAKMVIQSWKRTGESVGSTDIEDLISIFLKTLDKSNIGLVRAKVAFQVKRPSIYLKKMKHCTSMLLKCMPDLPIVSLRPMTGSRIQMVLTSAQLIANYRGGIIHAE